jgi:transposase
MMQLTLYGKKIWLYQKMVDFRCSIDGLCHLVINELKRQPKEGVYIFLNRGRDKLKCLSWHKNGFVLCYKRLEKGRFSLDLNIENGAVAINPQEMSWLLAGLEWHKMRQWGELNYEKFS